MVVVEPWGMGEASRARVKRDLEDRVMALEIEVRHMQSCSVNQYLSCHRHPPGMSRPSCLAAFGLSAASHLDLTSRRRCTRLLPCKHRSSA